MMDPRCAAERIWRAIGIAAVSILSACADRSTGDGDNQPNVLLLISDDQSAGDIGAYGNPVVATPHLDALARDGMIFDRAYAPEAMCTPSRSSMFTGLFPIQHGAHHNHEYVRDGIRSVPHHFGPLGYRVALAGKSHVGPIDAFPFEFLPGSHIGPEQVRIDRQMEDIRALIRDSTTPFFLVVADSRPHTIETEPGGWPAPVRYDPGDVVLPPYLVDTPETRYERAGYYDLVSELDALYGEILDTLDAAGKARDTIVIFVSDHGAGFPFEKWTNYDAGLRVPMIVRWPGRVAAGTRSDAMVSLVDVLPTLLELVGAPTADLDGRSFAGVLEGREQQHRSLIFGLHTNVGILNGGIYPIRSVRDERYSYLRNLHSTGTFTNNVTEVDQAGWSSWLERAESDPFAAARVTRYQHRPDEELYDLASDPFELVDLAPDPAHRGVLERLRSELDAWTQSQGDRGLEEERAP
jgi:N-sulfoglucosamine sulfohydrolase